MDRSVVNIDGWVLPLPCAIGTELASPLSLGFTGWHPGGSWSAPLVAVEDLQERVVPLGRRVGPGHLETAADGVLPTPGLAAEAHLLKWGGLGLHACR